MIIPFPAGGATDTLARFLGERLNAGLKQPIVIENVGGAAGSLGVGRAVPAAPDGYTLSIGTSTTHMLTGGLYALPFDLLHDLEPVILIGIQPLLIVGRKDLPADDLKQAALRRTRDPGLASGAAIAGGAARLSDGGGRALVADHQGVGDQGGANYSRTRSSFCRHRVARTTAGMSSSGKLVFQLVTPTSPT